MKRLLLALLLIFLFVNPVQAKFLNTYLVDFTSDMDGDDAAAIGQFDVFITNKYYHNNGAGEGNGSMWSDIKGVNASIEIYLYQMGQYSEGTRGADTHTSEIIRNISRWDKNTGFGDRDHSEGDISHDNEPFIMDRDGGGGYVTHVDEDDYFLDIGDADFRDYSQEALHEDIVTDGNGKWLTDGIYNDLCLSMRPGAGTHSHTAAKYSDTEAAWRTVMLAYVEDMGDTMAGWGTSQKYAINSGFTRYADGQTFWDDLDAGGSTPDAIMEEGAFVVIWGAWDLQYFPEASWKNQLDQLAATDNSKALFGSHCPSAGGTDNWGNENTFNKALRYALGSFCLGKGADSHFMMRRSGGYGTIDLWYDEYDAMDGGNLDFGDSVGVYFVKVVDNVNVYVREFEDGWVIVNPNNVDLGTTNYSDLGIYEDCRKITNANMEDALGGIATSSSTDIDENRAIFLHKVVGDEPPPVNSGIPCASTTLDGDDSTTLLVCEEVGASAFNYITLSSSPTNFSFGAASAGYLCGDSYSCVQGDGGNYYKNLPSTYTEFTALIVYKYPGAEDAFQQFVRFHDSVSGTYFAEWGKSSTDGAMVFSWEDKNDVLQDKLITGLSDGWYVLEIHWKDAQADAGILMWHYALGESRTSIDLTDKEDSTLDITGLNYIYVFGAASTSNDANERVELGVLKIRDGASACPLTSCETPSIISVTLRDDNLDPLAGTATSGIVIADVLWTGTVHVEWTGDPPYIPTNLLPAANANFEYYGMSEDETHLYFKRDLVGGERTPGAELDDVGNEVTLPAGATIKGAIAGEAAALTGVDIAGANELEVEVPKKNWKIGPAGADYATHAAFLSAMDHTLAGDRFFINGPTETITATVDGTESDPIIFMVYGLTGDFDVNSKDYVMIQGINNISGSISNTGTGYQGLYFSTSIGL